MRTVLMIAFLFPPRASIGGKRPLRFARHLPAHGWRPVVLAGPPILCETASGEMARILTETGTGIAVPVGDVDGMARCLARALDARGGGPAVAAPDRAAIERFSAPAITGELAALLDEIAG